MALYGFMPPAAAMVDIEAETDADAIAQATAILTAENANVSVETSPLGWQRLGPNRDGHQCDLLLLHTESGGTMRIAQLVAIRS